MSENSAEWGLPLTMSESQLALLIKKISGECLDAKFEEKCGKLNDEIINLKRIVEDQRHQIEKLHLLQEKQNFNNLQMATPQEKSLEKKILLSSSSAKKLPEINKFSAYERTTPKGLKPDSLQLFSSINHHEIVKEKKPSSETSEYFLEKPKSNDHEKKENIISSTALWSSKNSSSQYVRSEVKFSDSSVNEPLNETQTAKKKNLISDINEIIIGLCIKQVEKSIQKYKDFIEIRLQHMEEVVKNPMLLNNSFTLNKKEIQENFDRKLDDSVTGITLKMDQLREEFLQLHEEQTLLASKRNERIIIESKEATKEHGNDSKISDEILTMKLEEMQLKQEHFTQVIRDAQSEFKIKTEEKIERVKQEISHIATKVMKIEDFIHSGSNAPSPAKMITEEKVDSYEVHAENLEKLYKHMWKSLYLLIPKSYEKDFRSMSERFAQIKMEIFKTDEENDMEFKKLQDSINDIWNTIGLFSQKLNSIEVKEKKKRTTLFY